MHDHGEHYAFAVGTGILPFLDLIATILKCKHDKQIFQTSFKINLFVSFQSKEDAIGLELLELVAE